MPAPASLPPTDLTPEEVARRLLRPSTKKAKVVKLDKGQTATSSASRQLKQVAERL